MSKFTDDFFTFPIKIYDGFSLKKAMEAEDKDTTDEPVPIDWVVGWVKLPAKDLHKMMWHEGFSRERKVEEVAEKGFDLTIVISEVWGEFVSTWNKKKFEEKLNEFMEKWKATLPQVNVPFITYTTAVDPFRIDSPEGIEKKPE